VRDTSPRDAAAFTALFAARSAADRLRMTCEMFDAAKMLAAAGIRAMQPDISDDELRRRIFDQLYAGDFDPDTWTKFRSAV
jgi:hypothetical protein